MYIYKYFIFLYIPYIRLGLDIYLHNILYKYDDDFFLLLLLNKQNVIQCCKKVIYLKI